MGRTWPIEKCGSVKPVSKNKWRATVQIDKENETGPCRSLESDAWEDLYSARRTGSKSGVFGRLAFLKREAALARKTANARNHATSACVEDVAASFGRSASFQQWVDI